MYKNVGVAVDDGSGGQQKAEDGVEDQVGVVAPGPLLPAQRAGRLHPLWAVRAPAHQRCHGPEEAVEPHKEQAIAAAPHIQLEAGHRLAHRPVALIGQQRQCAQGHQTYSRT